MKEKKLFIIGAILVVLGLILSYFFLIKKDDNKESDREKFKSEYTNVTSDNPFVYRSVDQIINILEKGTGVVYLGFPECPWCQAYVPYVEEVAKKVGIDKVYYFNIKEDRKNNTEEYQKIVKILDVYLPNDDEGNKRIYVPAIIVVRNGKIIEFDDETSKDTKGYKTPEEYWKNENLDALKTKLEKSFNEIKSTVCKSGCND
jgi:thiol-disulfide isomerase/thioredoxin